MWFTRRLWLWCIHHGLFLEWSSFDRRMTICYKHICWSFLIYSDTNMYNDNAKVLLGSMVSWVPNSSTTFNSEANGLFQGRYLVWSGRWNMNYHSYSVQWPMKRITALCYYCQDLTMLCGARTNRKMIIKIVILCQGSLYYNCKYCFFCCFFSFDVICTHSCLY